MVSSSDGVYVVKESGLEFQHNKQQKDKKQDALSSSLFPTTPEIFLDRFRYVGNFYGEFCNGISIKFAYRQLAFLLYNFGIFFNLMCSYY